MSNDEIMYPRPLNTVRNLITGLALVLLATPPALSESIQLEQLHGVFMVPVRINDAVTIPFILDSGAAEVTIPQDVFSVLRRAGTVSQSEFIGTGKYTLADGSTAFSDRYVLHKIVVGNHVTTDVIANVAPVKGDPLLGQSFLSKLPAWTIDNAKHALVLNDAGDDPVNEILRRGNQALAAKDYAVAMQSFRKAGDQGNAYAQLEIGYLYGEGRGVPQDYTEAMRWYRLAADQGNAVAQGNIGLLYYKGWGVPQDYAQAMQWFRKAADQGYAAAQNNIGVLYQRGFGVQQDYAQAKQWFLKAADQGYTEGQGHIGWMYQQGLGVPQDYAQAMQWYRKAADRGNANAQISIGLLYQSGLGVQQDYAEAMRWYRLAADQGNALAQSNIALLFFKGWGVPKDCAIAKQWFEKAAAAGNDTARHQIGTGANGACQW